MALKSFKNVIGCKINARFQLRLLSNLLSTYNSTSVWLVALQSVNLLFLEFPFLFLAGVGHKGDSCVRATHVTQ